MKYNIATRAHRVSSTSNNSSNMILVSYAVSISRECSGRTVVVVLVSPLPHKYTPHTQNQTDHQHTQCNAPATQRSQLLYLPSVVHYYITFIRIIVRIYLWAYLDIVPVVSRYVVRSTRSRRRGTRRHGGGRRGNIPTTVDDTAISRGIRHVHLLCFPLPPLPPF